MQAKQKKHPFTYTLGNGPFEYAGYFDLGSRVNAMNNGRDYAECMRDAPKLKDGLGTCAHCGHAILNIMIVRNGDGELFGVGSDCVRKVYSDGDVKKISQMEKDIKAHKRELRIKRESEKIKELTPAYEAALIELEKRPHMNSYYASQGKTLADYFRFMARGSGSSKIRYMKHAIKRAEIIELSKGFL